MNERTTDRVQTHKVIIMVAKLALANQQTNRITMTNTAQRIASRGNKKLSYCWETVRRESMPRIAEMDMEMTN